MPVLTTLPVWVVLAAVFMHGTYTFLWYPFAYLIAWGFFWVRRVSWVIRARLHIIEVDFIAYERLPSFEFMTNTFWIWDVYAYLSIDKDGQ